MPKSRHRRSKKKTPRSMAPSAPKQFIRDLMVAQELLDNEKYVEAQDAFKELDRRFPNQEDVLVGLVNFMRKEDGLRAEEAFKQALEIEPDLPDITNNLAAAYSLQGRDEETEALIRETHERHPDYLFATTNLAKLQIQRREFEPAAELLKPLMSRKRLHFSELASICEANIFLYTEQNDPEKARPWLSMWEQVEPDHPNLRKWRARIESANFPRLLRDLVLRNLPE